MTLSFWVQVLPVWRRGCMQEEAGLNVLIIEKGQDGGQIAITDEIENYPVQIVEGEPDHP